MAKNNEAKIKFTAETKEFNDSIKKANKEMSELRAEAKLNETQMQRTGRTIEALENQHKTLSDQLAVSERKTEALSQKVDKAVQIYGENSDEVSKLRVQLLNAQTAEERIRASIDKVNSELDEQRNAMNQVENVTETMTEKVKRQESELSQLKRAYADTVAESGKMSDEAQTLAKEITDLSKELAENQKALGKAEQQAEKLDKSFKDTGEAAESAGDGFTIMKGIVADLASSAIQMAIGKISEFVGYLAELPSATMELRQDLATLTTSFDNVGMSSDTAKDTWKELYAVFGEEDRAVEASNLIAKMSDDQKDLNDWVTITTGVWGDYQDSLPVEGLAEASMESAKTGKVTGTLADALNWSSEAANMFAKYMGDDVVTAEDAFNEALAECTTEQERQQLITDTLTKLYGKSAETYRETAGAQMEAKEATADHMLAESNLASSIEPVTTAFTELKTMLLEQCAPAIEAVSGLATDALNWMKEHPSAVKAIASAVGILAVGLTGLAVAWGIYTVAQWAANSAMLVPASIAIGIVAGIAAIVAIVVLLVEHWDQVKAKAIEVWESVKATFAQWGEWINVNVVQPVKNFFVGLWESITTACSNAWEWVKGVFASFVSWIDGNVIQPIVNFFTGLWQSLQTIWNTICNVVQVAIMLIGSIISGAVQIITLPFRFIWENCKGIVLDAWNAIKNAVSTALNAIKTTISNIWNSIVSFLSPILSSIRNAVSNAWNSVRNATSTVFNAVKNTATNIWNSLRTAVSNVVNSVKNTVSNAWNSVKNATSNAFNAVKSVASSVWNSIKTAISNVVNGVKNTVSNVWNGIKSTTSSVFNSVKSTATSVWNNIKTAITKPIESARDKIKGIVDKIKGFFSGMKLELPKIKLPHFSIDGKLSLNPPSVPKLKIDWYADGGILMKPTIFGVNGSSLMAGGEAGPEAILPIDRLEGYIANAIEKTMNVVNLQVLADAVEELASRPIQININGREFAFATASDTDRVGGLRLSFMDRGLVLD